MFQCNKCGVCCRNLHKSEIYRKFHDGNGICRYLKGNECSIYENRPLICRVDECYEIFYKDKMSYDEYLQLTYKCCEILKNKKGE